ncbi:endonuclease/exonuclease/phosphatase family protein [Pseudokineococcus sp. 1T1Z-3]|uniref:endonuclease/exonuclease/phosphatase family protein n=1 Tax=Pseudokineococcus sp. 1T1Z-3 TaxID=3132745 RepID=UPI0030B66B70
MSGARPAPAPDVLRVLTWNVHGLRAGAGAVAHVLREARCDVALLQEGPRGLRTVPRAADLARRSGLLVAAAGRPAAGNLVLVAPRLAVDVARAAALPVRGLTTPVRGVAAAVLRRPGGRRLVVLAAHLGLVEGERRDHAARLAEVPGLLARDLGEPDDLPVVVGADLNEHPGGPSWSAVAPGGRDCWAQVAAGADEGAGGGGATFPASRPRARIDAVLARGVEPMRAEVLATGAASDHRAVVVDLVVTAAAAQRRSGLMSA